MQVHSYINFDGRCEEAVEFYKKALGAEVGMLMRYKESPEPPPPGMMPPGTENKIMHAQFQIGNTAVMGSDGHCQGDPKFHGITLNLTVDTVDEAQRYFNALTDGGKVNMPLTKTFFSPQFGMLSDRFGVNWMVYVAPKQK
jgi:PhnB protein